MQRLQQTGRLAAGAAPRSAAGGRLAACRPAPRRCFTAQRPARRADSVRARAYEWPDEELIRETADMFPEEGVANVEQARALFSSLGYTYLDVRPELELEEIGKVKGAVNIPFVLAVRRWDSDAGRKVAVKEDNPDFVAEVERRFPDRDTPLLVVCSNGRAYSMDALMALEEAGYSCIVGLRGGYNAWNQKFDNKLARRRFGEYQEEYGHGGDSAGIHGSGASFEKMDGLERWAPPEF